MIDCRSLIEAHAAHIAGSLHCRRFNESAVIVTTPYQLPDGDLIELVVEPRDAGVRVRDLGHTLGMLIAQGFDPDASEKRQWLFHQATRLTGVDVVAGELRKDGPAAAVGDLLLDVSVAARGVADLIYLHRSKAPRDFEERVVTFLTDQAPVVQPNAKVRGVSGKEYALTARVVREEAAPLLLTALSPRGPGQVKGAVDRTVRMWFDVNGQADRTSKVSFLNDASVAWAEADVRLLGKLSLVVGWRSRQLLVPVLSGEADDIPVEATRPLWEEYHPEE